MGRIVMQALMEGIPGYALEAVSEFKPVHDVKADIVDFDTLAQRCDLIVECLPPLSVPDLARAAFRHQKDLILISSAALILHPEILDEQKQVKSRITIPSGALSGLDGVGALAQMGIKSAKIASIKHPRGLAAAPYIINNNIDLNAMKEKTLIFKGSVLEAARGFPANVNVAATLALAGPGPEKTTAEVWADPQAQVNTHEITVEGLHSTITARVENRPDPQNPKTSMLAAYSILHVLKGQNAPLVIL